MQADENLKDDFKISVPRLVTIKQAARLGLYPNEGGIKDLVWKRKHNGFEKVVKRIHGRLFIDVRAYYTWIEEQNQQIEGDD